MSGPRICAYYGNESTVFLDSAAGVPISVNVTNETRRTTPAVAVGDDCGCPGCLPIRWH